MTTPTRPTDECRDLNLMKEFGTFSFKHPGPAVYEADVTAMLDEIRCLRARQSAQPVRDANGEAAGWQIGQEAGEGEKGTSWVDKIQSECAARDLAEQNTARELHLSHPHRWIVRPLYAAPPQPAETDAGRKCPKNPNAEPMDCIHDASRDGRCAWCGRKGGA